MRSSRQRTISIHGPSGLRIMSRSWHSLHRCNIHLCMQWSRLPFAALVLSPWKRTLAIQTMSRTVVNRLSVQHSPHPPQLGDTYSPACSPLPLLPLIYVPKVTLRERIILIGLVDIKGIYLCSVQGQYWVVKYQDLLIYSTVSCTSEPVPFHIRHVCV